MFFHWFISCPVAVHCCPYLAKNVSENMTRHNFLFFSLYPISGIGRGVRFSKLSEVRQLSGESLVPAAVKAYLYLGWYSRYFNELVTLYVWWELQNNSFRYVDMKHGSINILNMKFLGTSIGLHTANMKRYNTDTGETYIYIYIYMYIYIYNIYIYEYIYIYIYSEIEKG